MNNSSNSNFTINDFEMLFWSNVPKSLKLYIEENGINEEVNNIVYDLFEMFRKEPYIVVNFKNVSISPEKLAEIFKIIMNNLK